MKPFSTKHKQYISVVFAVQNASATIEKTLSWIGEEVWNIFEKFEIIVVDNASRDSTIEKIQKFSQRIEYDISIVSLPWVHKKEYALQAGLDSSIWDFIYEIQHLGNFYKDNIFLELFNKLKEGKDIVTAVPSKTNWSNNIFYKIINTFSDLPFELATETIVFSSRRALNSTLKYRQKAWQRKVMYKFSGFDMWKVFFRPTNKYHSQDNISQKMRLALDLIFSFTHLGSTIPLFLALSFFGLSIFIGIYALYVYFFFSSVVAGWTTQMLFLSVAFSWIFFILWFISRYMGIILSEVHASANYTVKKIHFFRKK